MAEKALLLQQQLQLTPAQRQQLVSTLRRLWPDPAALVHEYLSEDDRSPQRLMTHWAHMQRPERLPAAESAILAILTPDQHPAWVAWKAAELTNTIEVTSNRDLAWLQTLVTLTPAQKDGAFQALTTLNRQEATATSQPESFDIEHMTDRYEQRIDALSHILTPEQLGIYEKDGLPGAAQALQDPLTTLGQIIATSQAEE